MHHRLGQEDGRRVGLVAVDVGGRDRRDPAVEHPDDGLRAVGCVVDPGSVWGNVQVVDRGPAVFEIRDEREDARFELALREFARAVPRRDV